MDGQFLVKRFGFQSLDRLDSDIRTVHYCTPPHPVVKTVDFIRTVILTLLRRPKDPKTRTARSAKSSKTFRTGRSEDSGF